MEAKIVGGKLSRKTNGNLVRFENRPFDGFQLLAPLTAIAFLVAVKWFSLPNEEPRKV